MYRFRIKASNKVVWGKPVSPGKLTGRESILGAEYYSAKWNSQEGRFDVDESQVFRPSGGEVLAPIEQPPACVWAVGLNYRKHAEETGMEPPRFPTLFMKAPGTINGPFDPVQTPKVCNDEMDFEGELAIVIGKECKDVSVDNALDYVLGFCVANDISARRWQGKKGGGQWCRSKSYDTFLPLGPCLVPPQTVASQQAHITTTLEQASEKGKLLQVQHSSTADMIFTIPEIVSFISQDTTLYPWTVIITGTPEGVGFTRKPPLFLQPGDRVQVEIEGIGAIHNAIQ